MDNMNRNMLNLIASFKKTGQSDDVIKQSLWQMGILKKQLLIQNIQIELAKAVFIEVATQSR